MHLRALRGRRRLTPVALVAGAVGSAMLSLSVTGTFSALTATIRNPANGAGAGTVVMSETSASGSGSCISTSGTDNSAVCSTYNKYGGSSGLTPGDSTSGATVRIYSTGSVTPRTFTLTPGGCSVSSDPMSTPGSICEQLRLTVTCDVTRSGAPAGPVRVIDDATLSSIASTAIDLRTASPCLPPNGPVGGSSYTTFTFSVRLDPGAGNGVQGQTASQDLVWRFSS